MLPFSVILSDIAAFDACKTLFGNIKLFVSCMARRNLKISKMADQQALALFQVVKN